MVHLLQHLILSANHKINNYQGSEVKRGQLITGRKKLSEKTGISERTIRTCLSRLQETGEISIKATNKFSLITICNYETYQGVSSQNDPQPTSNRPAIDQQPTTNNNDKNNNNEEEEEKKEEKKKFAPPDFPEVKNYFIERAKTEFESSVDVSSVINEAKLYFDIRSDNKWIKANKQKVKNWKNDAGQWILSKRKNLISYKHTGKKKLSMGDK